MTGIARSYVSSSAMRNSKSRNSLKNYSRLVAFIYEKLFFYGNSWKHIFFKQNPLMHRVQISTRLLNKPLWLKNDEGSINFSVTMIDHCADKKAFWKYYYNYFKTLAVNIHENILKKFCIKTFLFLLFLKKSTLAQGLS